MLSQSNDVRQEHTAADKAVQFSIVELLNQFKAENRTMLFGRNDLQLGEVEEALLYLSKIGSLKLEGGFLVLYNAIGPPAGQGQ